MSKRMTAIAATALALAFGCEEGYGGETQQIGQDEQQAQEQEQQAQEQEQQAQQEERQAQQEERRAQQMEEQAGREQQQAQSEQEQQARRQQQGEVGTTFNQAPEEEPLAQAPQQRQQQQRQHPMPQGQMGQQAGSPGQIVSETSQRNFNQTISQLQRQMRENDLELVGQIRYDERQRQRLMREMQGQQGQQAMGGQQGQRQQGQQATGGQQGQRQQGQQAMGGQQATGGEIGDVRLLVFRRPDAEVMSIEHQGAEALLDAPRTVLVYERGDDVIVAYRAPEETAAVGTEEPTSELLARVVRNATQPSEPTAMRETERERTGQQQGRSSEMEDQRQARAPQQGRQTQAQN